MDIRARAITNKEIRDIVQRHIDEHTVMVFMKSYNPVCVKFRNRLTREYMIGVDHAFLDIDKEDNGTDIQAELFRRTGSRTVPQVFIHQEFRGGSNEIERLHRAGKLRRLIGQKPGKSDNG